MPSTYEPIATLTGTGSFTSIPSTYTDLKLVGQTVSGGQNIDLRFNGNSSSLYSWTVLRGDGSSATSVRSSFTYIPLSGDSFVSGFGFYEIDIFSYAGSTFKTLLSSFSNDANGSGVVARTVALWRSTAAVTQIDISNNGGNPLTLYGIKNA
jgi:hypothetical protein